MEISLRLEQEIDYKSVENLTREAFWNHYSPGCTEHYLVHIMRNSESFIKELAFVAIHSNQIVGNIMYTKAYVLRDGDDHAGYYKNPPKNTNGKESVLCFGPLSVLPKFQGKKIGSRLIEHSKRIAKELGYTAIIILGDPEFYKSTGFVPAEKFSIGTSMNTYADALLACELIPHALKDCGGIFVEDTIFEIDANLAEEFDKTFPSKEKKSDTPTQTRFLELLDLNKPRDNANDPEYTLNFANSITPCKPHKPHNPSL